LPVERSEYAWRRPQKYFLAAFLETLVDLRSPKAFPPQIRDRRCQETFVSPDQRLSQAAEAAGVSVLEFSRVAPSFSVSVLYPVRPLALAARSSWHECFIIHAGAASPCTLPSTYTAS